MIQITDNTKCVGCAACEQVCPVSCIKMRTDIEGFLYPVADADRCIQCDKCHKVCPVEHTNTMHCDESLKILGANHKNDQIRLKGSSGSVFFELAQYCIAQNGVVWGAAYISSDQVAHICVDSINDLTRLQKSKYVQSDLGNTFSL